MCLTFDVSLRVAGTGLAHLFWPDQELVGFQGSVTLHSAAVTGDLSQTGAVRVRPRWKDNRSDHAWADEYEFVIGGDPDRDTVDLAIVDTATGGVRAHVVSSADGMGYAHMLGWVRQHAPGRRIWALEGTGSFVSGLADALARAGEDVVEVGGLKRIRGPQMIVSMRSEPHAQRSAGSTRPAREPADFERQTVP